MKICFYLENGSTPNVDLSQPELGNPGCGGTEFLFSSLPHYMSKMAPQLLTPIVLANSCSFLPSSYKSEKVNDVYSAALRAKELDCSFFIYRPYLRPQPELLQLLESIDLPSVAWLHITPNPRHLRLLADTISIKSIVCVEQEQHDLILDFPLKNKLTYIVNGFDVDGYQLSKFPDTEQYMVTYLGALVPQKGFHLLARVWQDVLARYPMAKLHVIGSGALYKSDAVLGPLGLADSIYEKLYIIPYLTNNNLAPIPSVTFHGKLGLEKKELLYRSTIGIVNPTGQTENCPGSALEFQACSTPVVSGAYYGMMDTVINKRTGLLGLSDRDLINNICHFIGNPDKAKAFGISGNHYVKSKYSYSVVVPKWIALFDRLSCGKEPHQFLPKRNYHRHFKWLIQINRIFQKVFGKYFIWPTVNEIKLGISRLFNLGKVK